MSDHELQEEVAEVERIEKIVQEKEALKKKQMLQKLKELHEQDLTVEAQIVEGYRLQSEGIIQCPREI